ncbi:hypothetical protein BG015_009625 [Linnemannia schmuckeri]|uniref:Uncharacterized protein n=1 Tax=Linnemannia schmuckeri TaxID=64567 RepID=A0A9P5RXZ4_9FUNG|nr:hypothetical protein BG015_009625 [Linnemannia schmuckeri]
MSTTLITVLVRPRLSSLTLIAPLSPKTTGAASPPPPVAHGHSGINNNNNNAPFSPNPTTARTKPYSNGTCAFSISSSITSDDSNDASKKKPIIMFSSKAVKDRASQTVLDAALAELYLGIFSRQKSMQSNTSHWQSRCTGL